MLQERNWSKIELCASLFLVATLYTQAETTTNSFSVSSNKKVQFAPANYKEGETTELFQWSTANSHATPDANGWFVLSHEEWTYLLVTRDGEGMSKNALGQVGGVNGLIILSDVWSQPDGVPPFQPVTEGVTYANNHYTTEQWALMEAAGAVFLPCGGYSSDGMIPVNPDIHGAYWSSDAASGSNGYCIHFDDGYIHNQNDAVKTNYYSLRLVKEISGTPTGIDNINANAGASKRIENNHVVIIRNNEKYDVTGKKL